MVVAAAAALSVQSKMYSAVDRARPDPKIDDEKTSRIQSASGSNLIAAAPDMLEALKACVAYWGDPETPCRIDLHDNVTDVIRKATGAA